MRDGDIASDSRMIPNMFRSCCCFLLWGGGGGGGGGAWMVRGTLVFFSVLQYTGCALNYYSIYHCCRNTRMYARETGWGVTALYDSACFARTCECSVHVRVRVFLC